MNESINQSSVAKMAHLPLKKIIDNPPMTPKKTYFL